jgi:hypothetical protein
MPEIHERPPQRRRLLRLFGRVVAFACVAFIASCSTYVWSLDRRGIPEPPLLAGLPQKGGFSPSETQELTDRLVATFPIGSRESELVRELWLQGFRPVTDLSAHERRATFDTDRRQFNVCVTDGVVSWSADDGGRLTAISGVVNRACL